MGRLLDMAAAADLVTDGATIYLGGAVLRRKPMALCHALVAAGRRDLHVVTFAGSVEVEVLLAAGAVATLSTAYVGLGHHGLAPRFREAGRPAATSDGDRVDYREHSEWTLLGRLRAAAMGLPFLPTRGGTGSAVVAALGYAEVVDPYGGATYLAVPPLRPDVAVVHAWRATATGDVQLSWPPEHLWDVDVLAARAARTVIVTAEEVVAADVLAAEPHLTRLFGFEVDAVVHAPGGAWPTASPPDHDEDEGVIAAYVAGGADVALLQRGPG